MRFQKGIVRLNICLSSFRAFSIDFLNLNEFIFAALNG